MIPDKIVEEGIYRVKYTTEYQIYFFFILCIFTFLIDLIIGFNGLPSWFKYKNEIVELYQKKYFNRPSNNLPHLNLKTLVERRQKSENYKVIRYAKTRKNLGNSILNSKILKIRNNKNN